MPSLIRCAALFIFVGGAQASPVTENELAYLETVGQVQLVIQGNRLYRVDSERGKIETQEIDSARPSLGPPHRLWSGYPLERPTGAALDDQGHLYVVDPIAKTVFLLHEGQKPEVVFSG